MTQTTLIVVEHSEGRAMPVTRELLAFGRELGRISGSEFKAVVLAADPIRAADETARSFGVNVVAVRDPALTCYNGEAYRAALSALLSEIDHFYLCVAATGAGSDFAPGLAFMTGAACITGIESVFERDGRVCFGRSIYGGRLVAEVSPIGMRAILAVQPGSFKDEHSQVGPPGRVEVRVMEGGSPARTRSLGVKGDASERSALNEADVIVSVGRGLGQREDLALILRLSEVFPKSAVGCSRPLCDLGWLDYKRQIGLTGATVAPSLYLALGVSGSVQHVYGMRDSSFVAAVNTDPQAAIFNHSDVCIVEDLRAFATAFIEEWERSGRRAEDEP
jgi:electron transfer flavoprotein alpha subunit